MILKTPLVCLEFLEGGVGGGRGKVGKGLEYLPISMDYEKEKSVSTLPDQRGDDLQDGGIFDSKPRLWLLVILIQNLRSHSLRQNLEEDVVSGNAKLVLVKQQALV